ncbi:hypothetical protein [Actinomyces sp.]|uniref:hypothetical protein n=1 Tax=Actinomyces sp. TaxID=29317 RepID=UPI0026DB7FA0|nr:hypothetical protein [Actinomyces sp.]MDO4899965.1 hypothetical protein [Actinomyces sp.]
MMPTSSPAGGLSPLVAAGASGLTTAACAAGLGAVRGVSQRLRRVNYRGRTVNLRGGVAVAAGAVAAGSCVGRTLPDAAEPAGAKAAIASVTATLAAGVAGLIDDLDAGAHDGDTPAKGLSGHLAALRRGHLTTGALKVAVIGASALAAGTVIAATRSRGGTVRTAVDAATSAVVIASWANLHNLLDLRPGRALKVAALTTAPLLADPRPQASVSRMLAAGALGTTTAAMPADLGETTMLGDTGANALGALVGAALAAHPSAVLRTVAATTGTGLVLTSERVSFSRVIEANPILSAVDRLGRADQ